MCALKPGTRTLGCRALDRQRWTPTTSALSTAALLPTRCNSEARAMRCSADLCTYDASLAACAGHQLNRLVQLESVLTCHTGGGAPALQRQSALCRPKRERSRRVRAMWDVEISGPSAPPEA